MRSTKKKASIAGFVRFVIAAGLLVLQASATRGQATAPYTGKITDTSDWGKWKTNCGDMLSEFGKKTFIDCASSAFTSRPFHFLVQSIVPGSGVGGGGRYAPDVNRGQWQNQVVATSVVTIRRFWLAELKFAGERSIRADWNKSGESLGLNIYARNRSLPSMPFYGLGPNTNVNNSVRFSQRDTVAGIEVTSPFPGISWLSLGGKLEGLWPNVGGVSATNVISIQQQYNEQTAPGLTTQPPMVHEQISLNPHARLFEPFEIDYKIDYNFYQDTSTGRFSFRRFEANLEHHYYPQRDKRGRARLDSEFLFRWRYSVSDASAANAVPFYLQETLGGSDIENQPTLRAFRDYRFRGPDLMMVQAEYDRRLCKECKPCGQGTLRTVCTHLGLLVAYDAGKVALRKSDLDFSGMHQSFGGGFSISLADRVVFRVAVALGGGEGVHPYFGIADFLH
jgi:hypothetical protein